VRRSNISHPDVAFGEILRGSSLLQELQCLS